MSLSTLWPCLVLPQVGQPLRIALSGSTQAPGIGEIITALGVNETITRIEQAKAFLAH